MVADARDFVLSRPVCQTEKGSHLLHGAKFQALEISKKKWDQVVIDSVTCLPENEGKDTVLTVIDKVTKMVNFLPCTSSITGRQTVQLFWNTVGSVHGIPITIISDRDVRFTGSFWKEL